MSELEQRLAGLLHARAEQTKVTIELDDVKRAGSVDLVTPTRSEQTLDRLGRSAKVAEFDASDSPNDDPVRDRLRRRWMLVAASVIVVLALGLLAMAAVQDPDSVQTDTVPDTPAPSTSPTTTLPSSPPLATAPASAPNDWVIFSGDGIVDQDIFAVRVGSPARTIVGSDTDRSNQVCPELSADGKRLVFGQAVGNDDDGYSDAALVIGNLSASGDLTVTDTIPITEASLPPCANWSADGRWLAIALEQKPTGQEPNQNEQVWVMDTQTGDTRRLTDLFVSDLGWAPDRNELAIAGNGLTMYSVATDQLRPLNDSAGAGTLSWSPDGQRIAYQTQTGSRELWLINADGTDAQLVASGYEANHGIGPVWSPDGNHIAYQRLCVTTPDGFPCREQHEVVLLAVTDNDPRDPAGTQRVIPPPQTTGADGQPMWWYPVAVTWSRDGNSLLYDGGSSSGLLVVPLDSDKPPTVLYRDPSADE